MNENDPLADAIPIENSPGLFGMVNDIAPRERDIDEAHARLRRHGVEIGTIRERVNGHERRLTDAEAKLTAHHETLLSVRGGMDRLKAQQKQVLRLMRDTQRTSQDTQRFIQKHTLEEQQALVGQTNGLERLNQNLIRASMLGVLVALLGVLFLSLVAPDSQVLAAFRGLLGLFLGGI